MGLWRTAVTSVIFVCSGAQTQQNGGGPMYGGGRGGQRPADNRFQPY